MEAGETYILNRAKVSTKVIPTEKISILEVMETVVTIRIYATWNGKKQWNLPQRVPKNVLEKALEIYNLENKQLEFKFEF